MKWNNSVGLVRACVEYIMRHESDYQSYLVRLWREDQVGEQDESPAWQGELLHIQTGQKWPLHDVKDVLNSIKVTIED